MLFAVGVDCSCRRERRVVAALVVLRRDVKSMARLGGGLAIVKMGWGGWGAGGRAMGVFVGVAMVKSVLW